MEHKRVQFLKSAFNLQPHPEGGFYREVYRSADIMESPKTESPRNTITHIYYLLSEGELSRWHAVVHDEIWNVYEGDPLRILSFNANNFKDSIREDIIGDISSKMPSPYHKVVKGGDYQAACSTGSYTFLGCTVAPGFNFDDFTYIETQRLKNWVQNQGGDYAMFL